MATQRILFITHCEQGQSNVHLATAFEIHARAVPGVEVHLASFAPLRKRFERMRGEGILLESGEKLLPQFHTIDGLTHFDGIDRVGTMRHKPNFEVWPKFANLMVPWTPDEYVTIVDSIVANIESVDPHLILVDTLFGQAVDACNLLGRPYNVLSPLLASMVCLQNQYLAPLRYPLPGTGLPYPLPLTSIPLNLLHIASMVYHGVRSTQLRGVNAARTRRGIPGAYQGLECLRVEPGRGYITPGVRAVDLPFDKPDNLYLCGPISNDTKTLDESDPELVAWLDRASTVMMIMGTHFDYDAPLARRVLNGLLDGVGPDTQILWKVPNRKELDLVFDELLVSAHDRDRVRAVTWFDAEPAAILEHENIVAYVHHGGANSYFECARAGKPHVVLAQWADTYYNAVAVEYAGLGVYGNKTCAPDVDAKELSVALARVSSGEEGARFRERAREAGVECREAGGRKTAADIVLSLLVKEKKE
ncbi:glycosyltransferase family 1 protein [Schizophyllum commune Loenen D]|nr:glycosyltransferase family 1 protein [Schizophyllum commune Loenen D]